MNRQRAGLFKAAMVGVLLLTGITRLTAQQPSQSSSSAAMADMPGMENMPGMHMPMAAPSAPSSARGWTLAQLQALALRHNPTLRQAASDVAAAAGQVRQAGLWPNPTVGYQGSSIRGGYFRGGEQGVFVEQRIVLGHKLGLAQNVARQSQAEASLAREAQRQAVLNAVAVAYYRVLADQQEVQLRQRLERLAQDAVTTTKQLANVGQADQPDLLQAEVEAEQASLDVSQARQRQQQDWTQLADLTGQSNLQPSGVAGSLEEKLPHLDAETVLNRILTDSPQVKLAETGVARARAALKLAHGQAVPDLQLRAGMQQNREISDFSNHPIGWIGNAEVGVEIPVFNRNQGRIATRAAELSRAEDEVARVRLQLRSQAAPVIEAYRTSQEAVGRYRDQMLPQARQAYELYLNRYHSMAAAYPQVLVAQRTWFQLQVNYMEALRQLWTSASRLQGLLLTEACSRRRLGADDRPAT